ncbi:hypothetical protein MMC25_006697 [Agyrium rufum]|nr:hypothetical protein [Agyrium rufum]
MDTDVTSWQMRRFFWGFLNHESPTDDFAELDPEEVEYLATWLSNEKENPKGDQDNDFFLSVERGLAPLLDEEKAFLVRAWRTGDFAGLNEMFEACWKLHGIMQEDAEVAIRKVQEESVFHGKHECAIS